MKKVIACLLAVAFVLTMGACGGKTSKLDEVKAAGKLVVATSPDFPPFEYLDGTNVVGIEVDIMEKICADLGVKLELAQMDFDSVLTGIAANKYDIGMSGITVDEDRKKNSLFTDPYCLAAQAIVVIEESTIKGKADLDGKKVSAQTGTTAEKFTMSNGYQVSSFAANSDAEMALVTGKVDAWVIDDLTAAEMVAAYNAENETKLVILDEAMTTEPYAFATALGNDDLIAAINESLQKLLADGTVKATFEKYNAPYTAPSAN